MNFLVTALSRDEQNGRRAMRWTADPQRRALLRLRVTTAGGLLLIGLLVVLAWLSARPSTDADPAAANAVETAAPGQQAVAFDGLGPRTVGSAKATGPDALTGAVAVGLGSGIVVLLFVAGHRSQYGDPPVAMRTRSATSLDARRRISAVSLG
jgi:hypothetical protein